MDYRGQPVQGGYPNGPYVPQTAPPQVITVPYCADAQTISRFQSEIDGLRFRLEQKTMKEYALKQACQLQGAAYWTTLRSGKLEKFTDFVFEKVRYLYFDDCFSQEPLIEVKISGKDPVLLREKEFLNNQAFFNQLQVLSGGGIIPFGSVSQVATLLRSIASQKMERVLVPFYSGWQKGEDQWSFQVFRSFRTCAGEALPVPTLMALPEIQPAAAKVAAEQLNEDFEGIGRPELRITLLLWIHAAFLATPIEEICGDCFQYGLHITIPDAAAQDYLEKLACFGDDGVLSMEADEAAFAAELASRKDRPLLIREGCGSGAALKNLKVLRTALQTGRIKSVGKHRERGLVPIHTLMIILGDERSLLSTQPEVLPVQTAHTDFCQKTCLAFLDRGTFRMEYWAAFAAYAAREMQELERLLRKGLRFARVTAGEHDLPAASGKLLGVLLGVKDFYQGFLNSVGCAPLDEGDWLNEFLRTLEENSDQAETLDGLAEIFIEIGRQMIRDGRLVRCPYGRCGAGEDPQGTVFYGQESIALDRSAFHQICQEARCNPAAVKRDLREKGYLKGKAVNAQSYMPRMLGYNVYGQPQTIRVYQFDRSRFEKLGEPPLFS